MIIRMNISFIFNTMKRDHTVRQNVKTQKHINHQRLQTVGGKRIMSSIYDYLAHPEM